MCNTRTTHDARSCHVVPHAADHPSGLSTHPCTVSIFGDPVGSWNGQKALRSRVTLGIGAVDEDASPRARATAAVAMPPPSLHAAIRISQTVAQQKRTLQRVSSFVSGGGVPWPPPTSSSTATMTASSSKTSTPWPSSPRTVRTHSRSAQHCHL